ncbi:MAG TPA: (d)CMP kinase [Anaerolineae bacterium]|nr:(d)CMP kinase [Anaerolineae bacterium]
MNAPSTIAIDGPAASGKSRLGDSLAAALGYCYLDTGAMYRAVAWAALAEGLDVGDAAALTALAEKLLIESLSPTVLDGRQYTVLVDGRDVTWDIRQEAVEKAVSPISEYRGVRLALTEQQRRIAVPGRMVMVGRDIGTVVLPNAGLKIYLDASLEVRASRRLQQMLERDASATYQAALDSVLQRDLKDSQRAEAPLRPAEDAIVLDSTHLNAKQVLGMVWAIIEHGPWNQVDDG